MSLGWLSASWSLTKIFISLENLFWNPDSYSLAMSPHHRLIPTDQISVTWTTWRWGVNTAEPGQRWTGGSWPGLSAALRLLSALCPRDTGRSDVAHDSVGTKESNLLCGVGQRGGNLGRRIVLWFHFNNAVLLGSQPACGAGKALAKSR